MIFRAILPFGIHSMNAFRQLIALTVKAGRSELSQKRAREGKIPLFEEEGTRGSEFLFEQHEDRFVQLFHRKTVGRRGENGVVTGDGAENTFRLAQ